MTDVIMTKTDAEGVVTRTYVQTPSEIWMINVAFKIYFAPPTNSPLQFIPEGGKLELEAA